MTSLLRRCRFCVSSIIANWVMFLSQANCFRVCEISFTSNLTSLEGLTSISLKKSPCGKLLVLVHLLHRAMTSSTKVLALATSRPTSSLSVRMSCTCLIMPKPASKWPEERVSIQELKTLFSTLLAY
ncbi:hypothetical protein AAC387_Pa04g1534 [Persea americana]